MKESSNQKSKKTCGTKRINVKKIFKPLQVPLKSYVARVLQKCLQMRVGSFKNAFLEDPTRVQIIFDESKQHSSKANKIQVIDKV